MLELDLPAAGGTRQQRLRQALLAALLGGRLRAGELLPGTRALAQRLGLARNTVIAAYAQLEAEGYLQASAGAGYRVLADLRPVPARGVAVAPPRLAAYAARALALAQAQPSAGSTAPLRYDLRYGRPLPAVALASAWRRALASAVERTPTDYPPVAGLAALRSALAGYLGRRRGWTVDPDDVLVVSGAQQALELCVRCLGLAGGSALLEDPHYQGMRQAVAAAGLDWHALPVDGSGLDPALLPAVAPGALLLLTPAHQFPSGVVLAPARRLEILAWARRNGAWIVEDDYDGEFRFDAAPLPALKALDRPDDPRVIYAGTFSKALFPALRLGYLVLPPALRAAFHAVKWLADRGCAALPQAALAGLIASGRFERLLRAAGRELDRRRRTLVAALQQHCAVHGLRIEGQAAGMHLAVWFDQLPAAQAPELIGRAAREHGLGLYPIAPYYAMPPARLGLLLGYAGLPPADLETAARRFGQLLRQPG